MLGLHTQNAQKTFSFPLTSEHWDAKTDNAEFIAYKSTKAIRSSNEDGFEIVLKDFEFSVGTIEFDVELKGRGFPGINFHLDETTGNSEVFYLRYFGQLNPLSRTTMQYATFIDGVNLWDLTDDYQAGTALVENKWNHVKLVISENQMQVYVNNMNRVALKVPVLEGLTKTGKISLNGDVIYANFKVTPDETEDVAHGVGYDPTYNDPNYLRNWEVQEPIDFPTGKDPMQQITTSPGVVINSAYYNSSNSWIPVTAKHRGMVNLTEIFGATERTNRRLTWLRTTVTSKSEQEKWLRMGFSDEVWVFINGQPLHQNKNYYGSPGMKEPRGRCTLENTSFKVPLKEGENEILVGLSNYFFGWGMVTRWNDTSGLSYE
jgi:hypothetical protein